MRWRVYKSYELPPRPRTNPQDVEVRGDYALLPLYLNDMVVGHTEVDLADLAALSEWRWHPFEGYAARYSGEVGRYTILLHRELLGAPSFKPGGLQIDHLNHDRLDNRRANLRLVSGMFNAQNTTARQGSSRFRGVTFYKRTQRWRAQAKRGGVVYVIGEFDTELEAAAVAAAWRLKHMPGATD